MQITLICPKCGEKLVLIQPAEVDADQPVNESVNEPANDSVNESNELVDPSLDSDRQPRVSRDD